jgi:hypothetical protein
MPTAINSSQFDFVFAPSSRPLANNSSKFDFVYSSSVRPSANNSSKFDQVFVASSRPSAVNSSQFDFVDTLSYSDSKVFSYKDGVFNFIQSIAINSPTSDSSDATFGSKNLTVGISKETTDGSPSAPCLKIANKGMWRFKWVIKSGERSIYINCKQVINLNPRPTITIKANPSVGLNADIVGTAPSGVDWVTIGPLTFTAASKGVVYVELSNNYITSNESAFFDHIVVT